MLPASIQVCPVEIPGRGRREGEESVNCVAALAEILALSLPLQVLIHYSKEADHQNACVFAPKSNKSFITITKMFE